MLWQGLPAIPSHWLHAGCGQVLQTMPRRGIHPVKRTMTLVLNNGASINLSTMLQTSKPLKLTQVSVCSLEVNYWQCGCLPALLQYLLPPVFKHPTMLLPARLVGSAVFCPS